jgi:hypothetical protein
MSKLMVSYEVKPDMVEENVRLVRAVYAELASRQPDGLRYATFQLDGGTRFVHIASVEDGRENPLLGLPAFAAFLTDVGDRCLAPPVTEPIDEVGSYRV